MVVLLNEDVPWLLKANYFFLQDDHDNSALNK